jgi:hypothetical protein
MLLGFTPTAEMLELGLCGAPGKPEEEEEAP